MQIMKQFWNDIYSEDEFIYGTEPNDFFKRELANLSVGNILLPAEGEGRNAVYAASKGWAVTAFDYSETGKTKTMLLAEKNNVKLEYSIADYSNVSFPVKSFDVIALIYTHTPNWKEIYTKLFQYLKPNGTLILELFNKKQINNSSGGPKDESMLLSAEEFETLLIDFNQSKIWEDTCDLNVGKYHTGFANILRCIAKK